MTDPTPAPDAAVQIAAAAVGYETHSPPGLARAVVAALATAGWLHDPAECENVSHSGQEE